MGIGPDWIVAAIVALLIGGGATFYIRRVMLRRDETEAGIRALSAASWREFIHLVLEALSRRGYSRVVDQETASGDSDYTLERDGRRWLLSCKHGSAFVLGNASVEELGNDIRLANASGGFLFTQGRITDEARAGAAAQNIELLDGPTLWPELRDLIKSGQLTEIRAVAERHARQRTLLAWLLATLAGIVLLFLLPDGTPAAPTTGARDGGTSARTPAAAPSESRADTADTAESDGPDDDAQAPPTPAQEREAVARTISTLPMVDRAVWPTQSTLEVYLLDAEADAMSAICPLIERYPELAASRIQLTPPHGSDLQVRFRQCRPY